MKRRIKINGIIIFSAFCVVVIFPRVFFRPLSCLYWEIFLTLLGLTLLLLGQRLRILARGYKSEHSKEGHTLVVDGPYSLMRNPMYLGILLIGSGIVLILFQWWVLILFLAVFALRYLPLISAEEEALSRVFPAAFKSYQKQTPRFFPRLKVLCSADACVCLWAKPEWVKKEINSIIAVIIAVLILGALRVYLGLKCFS